MDFDNPVHNRYISTFDLENEYLPSLEGLVLVVGEEETIEGWLHAATKDTTKRGRGGEGGGRKGGRRVEKGSSSKASRKEKGWNGEEE